MSRKLVVTATAAALTVLAGSAAAKPINYAGEGCAFNIGLGATTVASQTFKPTFSFIKQVKFVLFGTDAEDLVFAVNLRDSSGVLATSDYGVLSAGTSYEDAVAGDALVFKFAGGVRVSPGQAYRLELVRISGASDARLCIGAELYADGALFVGDNMQAAYDAEFAATGGGRPK